MKKIFALLIFLAPVFIFGQAVIDLDKTYIDSSWQSIDVDTLYFDKDSVYIVNGGDTMKFVIDDTEALRLTNLGTTSRVNVYGNLEADYAASSADANETRHFDFAVVGTVDPAGSAEVNSGYFAYNKTAGSNGTYTINALEGVARSSYADEAGTFRGVYGRIYINADATSTMRTGIGGEFSARAGYSGGTEVVAENGTAFVGSRIWMAPYFSAASLGNINNFHGLWIYNEATAKKVTNGIFINDAGGTGGWTYGLSLNGATIGTADIILNQGATLFNSGANTLTITEPTVAIVGALQALKTTEQFRLSYDATNYLTATLLDDGHTTFTTVDPDGAEADINFNPDGNVGIKTVNPSTALQVTGTTTTTGAIITNMATANTTVLSPTSTGLVDSLETVDLATEDFTVTGLWTFDNVVVDSIDADTIAAVYINVTNLVVSGNVNYAADAQADDDYEIDIPGISALTAGLTVTFLANTANTDGATLEITEVGDLDAILKMHDQVLATGDIEAGQIVVCVFDGTNWQMISQIAQ